MLIVQSCMHYPVAVPVGSGPGLYMLDLLPPWDGAPAGLLNPQQAGPAQSTYVPFSNHTVQRSGNKENTLIPLKVHACVHMWEW